jgi:acetylornithine deacetylase
MTVEAEIRKKICDAIVEQRSALIDDLASLVKIPSIVGSEGAAQAYMRQRIQALGMEIDEFEADPDCIRKHPAYVPIELDYRGRPNVVGTLRGTNEHSLVLNGHVDVVSAEPVSTWSCDPWGAKVKDGKLYGRGANDMKGGLIAAVWAIEGILRAGFRPIGKLILQSVIEEEAGGSGGTLACLLRGHTAEAMLIPEPQSRITVAHIGVLYFRIRVKGRSAHAGQAHLGVNAIGKLNVIYDALTELDCLRGEQLHFSLIESGSGRSCHICIGTYRAGDWPSTVAGEAMLEARMSFLPGETQQQIRSLIERTVAEAASADPWLREHSPVVEWFGWCADPWRQSPEHPFISTLSTATSEVLGKPAPINGKAAAMDTRFAAYFGMAAASYGTEGGNIHGPDEFVLIDSVVDCAQVIALTTAEWCGLEKS